MVRCLPIKLHALAGQETRCLWDLIVHHTVHNSHTLELTSFGSVESSTHVHILIT
jgi:hypothetical protein